MSNSVKIVPHLALYLYHRNLNCTNQTYDFEIGMILNDEYKSDP